MPDYEKALNEAQLKAVTSPPGNTLVVAGAGTGKTRTIIYRLAWLIERGCAPESLLLLTFTRKAAQEMLSRAQNLLGKNLGRVTGGTFHSFAFGCLRIHKPAWLMGRPFTLMDSADISKAIKDCKESLKIGKRDHSFPKIQTIIGLLSKARNKELPLSEILRMEGQHLLPHASAIEDIGAAYAAYRRERALMDYDDLLFELEDLLVRNPGAASDIRSRFTHILVDEYQDTNLVQARITLSLAQPAHPGCAGASVMAVGDEAQSIYAFRGANVRNILDFPKLFPNTNIVRLEQNYRSTQSILDAANSILANAHESFRKSLFTHRQGGHKPVLARPLSDISEAEIIARRIGELLATHQPYEIAVLFRAGFHSYPLENALRKAGIQFRKYGGLRFVEAAHIKDMLAYARLAINPHDLPAFGRLAQMHRGIGPKTAERLHAAMLGGRADVIARAFARYQDFWRDLALINDLRQRLPPPLSFFETVMQHYRPRLEELYPDDWPARLQGLEEILTLAAMSESLELFVADLALETPDDNDDATQDVITLSTIHSAKGLEWKTVILLDMVEDRFPSRHAQIKADDYEEERRLFYVACTRAMDQLEIYAPRSIYGRNGSNMTAESPFLRELPDRLFRRQQEGYANNRIYEGNDFEGEETPAIPAQEQRLQSRGTACLNCVSAQVGDYCRHRIFGRGKILQKLGDDRIQVEFSGFGRKIILAQYLFPEE